MLPEVCFVPFLSTQPAFESSQMGITFADFAKNAKISVNTLAKAVHGEVVAERIANSISGELGVKTETLFNIEKNKKPLSNKTILEHHRFISVVFNQAEKEMLVQYNPAERATPPRVEQKEARNTRNGTMSKHKSGAVCGKIPGLYLYRRTALLWTRQVLPDTAVHSQRNTDFHISTHTRSGTQW